MPVARPDGIEKAKTKLLIVIHAGRKRVCAAQCYGITHIGEAMVGNNARGRSFPVMLLLMASLPTPSYWLPESRSDSPFRFPNPVTGAADAVRTAPDHRVRIIAHSVIRELIFFISHKLI